MGASLSCVRWAGRVERMPLRGAPDRPPSFDAAAIATDLLVMRRVSREGSPAGFEDASALLMEVPEAFRPAGRALLLRTGSGLRAELGQALGVLGARGQADTVIRELMLEGKHPALLTVMSLLLMKQVISSPFSSTNRPNAAVFG